MQINDIVVLLLIKNKSKRNTIIIYNWRNQQVTVVFNIKTILKNM